jgi:pimeloyl-ACP methyl ester carboxylesterase
MHQHIDVNGLQLEVLHIAGGPAAKARAPLVFLHEGLGSVAMWRQWPAQLCALCGREGWVYSRAGYGQSQTSMAYDELDSGRPRHPTSRLPPDYMHQEAWKVLPALLHALHVREPVLVGHSDGGSIALLHASRFAVAACAVLAPHVIVEDMSVTAIAQARIAYETGQLRERLRPYHADVDSAFWQWNDVWLSDAFRAFDIRPDTRGIQAPVLALQGLDDPYGSMRQIDEIELTAPQIRRVALPQCGHQPHKEQTDLTNRLLVEFLADKP